MRGSTNLLAVDDDGVDVLMIRRAVSRAGLQNPIAAVCDGVEALDWLRSRTARSERLADVVVLLDLNMPRMNGHEFLAELRRDPALNRLVVFVLTTSRDPKDVQRAYQMNVAGYFLKDMSDSDYSGLVGFLQPYLETVLLPS
jgi:CheY-like chemotaxis protein